VLQNEPGIPGPSRKLVLESVYATFRVAGRVNLRLQAAALRKPGVFDARDLDGKIECGIRVPAF
jgi:hypothetical protein